MVFVIRIPSPSDCVPTVDGCVVWAMRVWWAVRWALTYVGAATMVMDSMLFAPEWRTIFAILVLGGIVLHWMWTVKVPIDQFIQGMMDAGSVDVVAEELLVDEPVNLAGVTQGMSQINPGGSVMNTQQQQNSANSTQLVAVQQVGVATPQPANGAPANQPSVVGNKAGVLTPPVEVRGHRVVALADRPSYARKVMDECKAKFGTPAVNAANYRAVWKFAHQIMTRHGLRPSHMKEQLPFIVALVFEPSEEERKLKHAVGSWKELQNGRYEEYLNRLARWSRERVQATF